MAGDTVVTYFVMSINSKYTYLSKVMWFTESTMHPRLSERRELKCRASRSDKSKIRISEDGNMGRQNNC